MRWDSAAAWPCSGDFLERHRAALAAPELAELDREPQEMARLLQTIVETSEEAQRAEETYWQRIADLADSCQVLVLDCLRKLAWLESMPQEEWDAMAPDTRVHLSILLEALRPFRESVLGTLPIEPLAGVGGAVGIAGPASAASPIDWNHHRNHESHPCRTPRTR